MINFKGKTPKIRIAPVGNMFLVQRKRNRTELFRVGNSYQRRLENNSIKSARILNCQKSDTGIVHIFYEMEHRNNDCNRPIQEGRYSLSVDAFFKSFPYSLS